MEEVFKAIARMVALSIEGAATILIAYGAAEAIYGSALSVIQRRTVHGQRQEVWMRFGVWLLLGLEFELAADIIRRSAITPTWSDIGQLAAIGFIRTFLNCFLERDLDKYEGHDVTGKVGADPSAQAA
jgi:uncharacterized membrane protein